MTTQFVAMDQWMLSHSNVMSVRLPNSIGTGLMTIHSNRTLTMLMSVLKGNLRAKKFLKKILEGSLTL